jgi:hypothetical protein
VSKSERLDVWERRVNQAGTGWKVKARYEHLFFECRKQTTGEKEWFDIEDVWTSLLSHQMVPSFTSSWVLFSHIYLPLTHP